MHESIAIIVVVMIVRNLREKDRESAKSFSEGYVLMSTKGVIVANWAREFYAYVLSDVE